MILIDTSVWIDHLNQGEPAVRQLIDISDVLLHPFVLAEIALGSMRNRVSVLSELGKLPAAHVVSNVELLTMIEGRELYSTGLALADAHLIATALLDDQTLIWTRDKRLEGIADRLGVSATVP